jgi:hypothetical protein
MMKTIRTLEEQKEEFKRGKLLATPLAGLIAWYLMPNHRFIAMSFAIVGIYAITIAILINRNKRFIRIDHKHVT